MPINRPILVVEDDANDADVITSAIREIGVKNKVMVFSTAVAALEYLEVTADQPLIILCDIRMPGLDGLAMRQHIHDHVELRKKAIPFVFLTGVATQDIVNKAYLIGVQGFYKKANSYTGIKDQLLTILIYWKNCIHPNSFHKEHSEEAKS